MGASRSELYRADELKAKLSAEKTAHSSGLTVAESDSLIGHATVTDAVAAFMVVCVSVDLKVPKRVAETAQSRKSLVLVVRLE